MVFGFPQGQEEWAFCKYCIKHYSIGVRVEGAHPSLVSTICVHWGREANIGTLRVELGAEYRGTGASKINRNNIVSV